MVARKTTQDKKEKREKTANPKKVKPKRGFNFDTADDLIKDGEVRAEQGELVVLERYRRANNQDPYHTVYKFLKSEDGWVTLIDAQLESPFCFRVTEPVRAKLVEPLRKAEAIVDAGSQESVQ